jgi:hypothetical protein
MLNNSPVGVNTVESMYSVFQFDMKLQVVNMWISQKVSGKMFYNLFVLATFFPRAYST